MGCLYNAGKDAAVTSLVLPAFNPGPAIERTWDSVRQFLNARPDPWEVLFALDGCTDGTRERLGVLARRDGDPRMRVVSYFPNRGKGYAVRTGLLAARGDRRLFTDVDLAYRFEDIARTADELRHGAEVAIASREHPDSTIQLSPQTLGYAYRRRVQSHVFGTLARTLLPLTQRDTQAGLKGVTARVAEQVVPNLDCDGFGFDCELLAACARYGIHVHEVPVSVRYEDAASTTGPRTTLRMVGELWSARRRWPRRGFHLPLAAAGRHNARMTTPRDALGPGGPIATRWPGFEARPEQLAMADAVAAALAGKHKLLVEAGTGVGKSFAYLVPAVMPSRPRRITGSSSRRTRSGCKSS